MSINELVGLKWDIRDGTTDWNTINACATADEYEVGDIGVEGGLIFDIGCHVGGFGVWLASRGATVVFVDPVPSNIEQVKKNLELNGLTGYVFEAALGADHVYLGPEGDEHEFISGVVGGEGARKIECRNVSLTALVQSLGIPHILKLDCEGGEWEAFRDPAIHHIPLIVGEYHPNPDDGEMTAEDIAWLLPEHDVVIGDNRNLGGFRATNTNFEFGPRKED